MTKTNFKTGAIDHSTTPPSLNGAGANACRSRTLNIVPAFQRFVDPGNLPNARESKAGLTLWTELDRRCGRRGAGLVQRSCRCKGSHGRCSEARKHSISSRVGFSRAGRPEADQTRPRFARRGGHARGKTGAIDHSTTPPSLNGAGANACRSRTLNIVPAFQRFVDPGNLPNARESKAGLTLWTELDRRCGRRGAGLVQRSCRCKGSHGRCSEARKHSISSRVGFSRAGRPEADQTRPRFARRGGHARGKTGAIDHSTTPPK